MPKSDEFFPAGFVEAATAVWGTRVTDLLAGFRSSVPAVQEPSATAGKVWLASQGVTTVFLSDSGLQRVCNAVDMAGKTVDFVAQSSSGGLILLETKSILDSASLHRTFRGTSKFDNSIRALAAFYAKGRQTCPPIERLLLTAREIRISGHSKWRVGKDGALTKGGTPVIVSGIAVTAVTIPFST